MINPFDQIFTKEEKANLLSELEQLKKQVQLLKTGNPDSIASNYSALLDLIKSFLTSEEKDILAIQAKVQEFLMMIKSAAEYSKTTQNEIEFNKTEISSMYSNIKAINENVAKKSEEIDSHLSNANDVLTKATATKELLAKLESEIEQLGIKADTSVAKIQAFEQASESVEDSKNKILLTQKNMRELLNKTKQLFTEIFGGEEKNEETGEVATIEGLVSKLESAYDQTQKSFQQLNDDFEQFKKDKKNELTQFTSIWNDELIQLQKRIESLLPGALSAGLSQAYEEKKNFEITEIKKSSRTFYIAIIGLTIISILPVSMYVFLLAEGEKSLDDIALLAPNVFLAMMPLYIPCLWVAYSSDKKAKLSKRLAEEYAHKSSLSKTFEGISRQVSNLDDNKMSAHLESRLLYNLIQVSSENPGKLISDYDKSDHPLYEALDKGIAFSETLEKISFIPGIDKLMASVQRRTKKRIENLTDGLDDEEKIINEGSPQG